MAVEEPQRGSVSPADIKKHCARIALDGLDQNAACDGVGQVSEFLFVNGSAPIIDAFIESGYPKTQYRMAGLPKHYAKHPNNVLTMLSIPENSKGAVKLYGTLLGLAVFFGSVEVYTKLAAEMGDTLGKTHFMMVEDISKVADDQRVKIDVDFNNPEKLVSSANARWTLLEAALASPNPAMLTQVEARFLADGAKSVWRDQLRVGANKMDSPISKMVRYFIHHGHTRQISSINRLLNYVESGKTFAEHFNDVIFDMLRKSKGAESNPDWIMRIPGLHSELVDAKGKSWSLYIDAFIPEEDQGQYSAYFKKSRAAVVGEA